jgi:hypothetical protein
MRDSLDRSNVLLYPTVVLQLPLWLVRRRNHYNDPKNLIRMARISLLYLEVNATCNYTKRLAEYQKKEIKIVYVSY